MKRVLNAIGGFFKKIGRWIKETAWIQPVLIVGAIFGLIMSIKPISNWITGLTKVTSESNFYKTNLVNYEELVKKVDENGEEDVLIVIFIKEENEQCEQCISQQKDFENFFAANHSVAENGRKYSIAVLDIAADEFDEDEVKDDEVLRSVHEDIIEKWALDSIWDDMPSDFNAPGGTQDTFIDLNSEDPLPTPTIARFDGNTCVGVAMGYEDSNNLFLRFCYADDVDNSQETFKSVPGEK